MQALQLPGGNRRVLISTTLQVISITLVVVGGALPSLLRALGMGETESLDPGEMEGVTEAVTCSAYDVEGEDLPNSSSIGDFQDAMPFLSHTASSEDVRPLLLSNHSSLSSNGGGSIRVVKQQQQQQLDPFPDAPPRLRRPGEEATLLDESWVVDGSRVFEGRVHRMWAGIDEALKPFFGGRSRLPTFHGSYVSYSNNTGGSYARSSGASLITVRPGHEGYGTLAALPPSAAATATMAELAVAAAAAARAEGGEGGERGKVGVAFPDGGMQKGGSGQGAGDALIGGGANTRTTSRSTSRGKIDPYALQAAFISKGFRVPKRTLSKLASQKPDGSSERKMRVSKSSNAAKK